MWPIREELMQPEDTTPREDATPAKGIKALVGARPGTPHVHFWSDVTVPASHYVEEVCNGEKWSPASRDYVFPKGCGAKRRILKETAAHPPESAWEIVGSEKP
jgi:hypothetical protein